MNATEEIIANKCLDLYMEGWTIYEIAGRYGIDQKDVTKWIETILTSHRNN